MSLSKNIRLRSEKNIKLIKSLPCAVCCKKPVDCHHWKSVGSGGDDRLSNLVPLCRKHHNEFHQIGKLSFYEKYEKKINCRKVFGIPDLEK